MSRPARVVVKRQVEGVSLKQQMEQIVERQGEELPGQVLGAYYCSLSSL